MYLQFGTQAITNLSSPRNVLRMLKRAGKEDEQMIKYHTSIKMCVCVCVSGSLLINQTEHCKLKGEKSNERMGDVVLRSVCALIGVKWTPQTIYFPIVSTQLRQGLLVLFIETIYLSRIWQQELAYYHETRIHKITYIL